MIDTIKITKLIDNENSINLAEIRKIADKVLIDRYYMIRVKFRSLIIEVKLIQVVDEVAINGYLTIHGSIPKSCHGTNLSHVNINEVLTLFKRLSSDLGLNILECTIRRLHLSGNIVLKEATYKYLQMIFNYPRRKKGDIAGETVYFENKTERKGIYFYNKVQEIKDKKEHTTVPSKLLCENILRIEVKVDKQPTGVIFGNKEMTLKTLLQKKHYNLLIDYWKGEIKLVQFQNLQIDNLKTRTNNDFKKWLSGAGLIFLGYNQVIQKLNASSIKDKSGIRSFIKNTVLNPKTESEINSLYKELENSVMLVYNFHKNCPSSFN